MQQSYQKLSDFLDDAHKEISLRDLVVDLGIWEDQDFKGSFVRCPFHGGGNERTPSLQVGDHFFKCYAEDNTKGDLFRFLEIYYHVGFLDAVQMVADHFGVSLEGAVRVDKALENRLQAEWEQYLQNMQHAPKEVQQLCSQYFPQQVGLDVNLGTQGYLVLPYTSKMGKVLGFTKRRICEEDQPKWKHSYGEDSLLHQCGNFWNLGPSREAIGKTKEAIIVEGPKDAIGYRRAGMEQVVAICGSHNTERLAELLPDVKHWVVSMDADESGVTGTASAILKLAEAGVSPSSISVITLPEGDPYDQMGHLQEFFQHQQDSLDWWVHHADVDQTAALMEALPDHLKGNLMQKEREFHNWSVLEVESWLQTSKIRKKQQKEQDQLEHPSERDILLAVVGKKDLELKPDQLVPYEKAVKILKMKYGLNVQ